jgi:hypothetical protein
LKFNGSLAAKERERVAISRFQISPRKHHHDIVPKLTANKRFQFNSHKTKLPASVTAPPNEKQHKQNTK